MQKPLYLLTTTLALFTMHATIICARPSELPPDQYAHSLTPSQSGLHLLLPKQLPSRLPTLQPRENLIWTLNDGWTFFLTTFAQTLPIEEASSVLQSMYAAFQTFSQSRSSSLDGPTRDAVSLSFHGLGTWFRFYLQGPVFSSCFLVPKHVVHPLGETADSSAACSSDTLFNLLSCLALRHLTLQKI